jgi:hypothetical protein
MSGDDILDKELQDAGWHQDSFLTLSDSQLN